MELRAVTNAIRLHPACCIISSLYGTDAVLYYYCSLPLHATVPRSPAGSRSKSLVSAIISLRNGGGPREQLVSPPIISHSSAVTAGAAIVCCLSALLRGSRCH